MPAESEVWEPYINANGDRVSPHYTKSFRTTEDVRVCPTVVLVAQGRTKNREMLHFIPELPDGQA